MTGRRGTCRIRGLAVAVSVALGATVLTALPATANGAVFADGVASGDVTHAGAIIWTRANTGADVIAEVASDDDFDPGDVVWSQTVTPDPGADYTIKLDVTTGLAAGTSYWYRFTEDDESGDVSDTGRFRTAPDPNVSAPFKMVYTGDANTLIDPDTGEPVYGHFEVLSAAAAEDADVFGFLGDTIYSDDPAPITALADYRDKYKAARDSGMFPATQEILRSTSTIAEWSDHEVVNDWNPLTVDATQRAHGEQVFREYMPLRDGGPLYRSFKWGKDIEIFSLDGRSYRSPQADADPAHPGICNNTYTGEPDLAPTAPALMRAIFGALLTELQYPTQGDCLGLIRNSSRTMLGLAQKTWLKTGLQTSTAKFKLIMNETPIQEYFALPYDRWEGYEAERRELINFIKNNNVQGVLWLTTDTHAVYNNTVRYNVLRKLFPPGTSQEVVVGPVGTETYSKEVQNVVGSIGPIAVSIVFWLVGTGCVNLDVNSYSVVQYDPGAAKLTVTPKNAAGAPICNPALIMYG